MYVTNVTVLRGDRGFTEVTPYDILEAVHRVLHGQASGYAAKLKENTDIIISYLTQFSRHLLKEKLHVAKFQCNNLLTRNILDHTQLT